MMRVAILAGTMFVTAAGCAPQRVDGFDRAWEDSGCEAAEPCRVRGHLEIVRGVPHSGGVLTMDDGRCIAVALPPEVIEQAERWDGRRVAIQGYGLHRAEAASEVISLEYAGRVLPIGLCPTGAMVLYAQRLSQRGAG